jgi:hypothetical protein
VLVDDGTCPSGQIKEVIGGNHVKVGGCVYRKLHPPMNSVPPARWRVAWRHFCRLGDTAIRKT